MDKLEKYQKYLVPIIERCGRLKSKNSNILTQLIIDKERNHYLAMRIGWSNENTREYGVIMHFDIIDGKIWVQEDLTDFQPVNDLLEKGVPKEDIVIGFMSENKRRDTEFAIQ